MAGWLHLKVDLIKGGMAKYGIRTDLQALADRARPTNDYLIFEGISVDEQGKQYYLDVHIAYRQACLNAIEYLTKFGYTRAPRPTRSSERRRARATISASSTSRTPARPVASHRHFRLRRHAVRGRTDQARPERDPDADVAGQMMSLPATVRGRLVAALALGGPAHVLGERPMPVYDYLCERCGPFTDMRADGGMRYAEGLPALRRTRRRGRS